MYVMYVGVHFLGMGIDGSGIERVRKDAMGVQHTASIRGCVHACCVVDAPDADDLK